MPWKAEKRGTKWVVINETTGEVKSHHKSMKGARRAIMARYANIKGKI